MMRQPEVKKGIVPYKMAKKRQEGGYVLPDGTAIDNVTTLIQESLAKTFFTEMEEENGNNSIARQLKHCIEKDCDVDNREAMRRSLVVAGGTSMVPYFDSMFKHHVLDQSGSWGGITMKTTAKEERKFLCW